MFSIPVYTLSAVGDSTHLTGSLGTVSSDYDVVFNALGVEYKEKISLS